MIEVSLLERIRDQKSLGTSCSFAQHWRCFSNTCDDDAADHVHTTRIHQPHQAAPYDHLNCS